MERRIISIGYEIPGSSDSTYDYASDQSLLDADIVIFEPDEFDSDSEKPSYDESYSFELKENTRHWRTELSTALEYGKTVFVVVRKYRLAKVHTGKQELKGSKVINYVEDYSNYAFLPIEVPPIIARGGSEIVYTGHPAFANFWKDFNGYLKYESYFDGKIKTPVFVTKTGERTIGGVFKVGKGNLVFIPPIEYDEEKFTKHDTKNNKVFWTKEAVAFGNKLVNSLFEIDKVLRSDSQKTPPPNWIQEAAYSSEEEFQIISNIETLSKQLENLGGKKNALLSDLEKVRQSKDLLFETGKRLENAVTNALRILGYSAENYNDGNLELDQVILSPEGDRFIGECEGKDTSAVNIDKFRQLEENIQSDLQRPEVKKPAIGILFGNGFRLTKPQERNEQFTAKCLTSAKRGTVLVRTMDMYPLFQYLKKNKDEDFAKECRRAILTSVGGVVSFPAIPKV
ncbi:MAG TPA: hypothetical protein DEP53_04905 [Bacteroidetes bacterium]|nr:hypothetical protein [Bacteroidota bacterium]